MGFRAFDRRCREVSTLQSGYFERYNIMTPQALLVVGGAFVFLALFTLLAAVFSSLELADVGVPVSLFSAVAGFLFNSAVRLHSEARDRAFEFLKEHSESEELKAATFRIGAFDREHPRLGETEAISLVARMIEVPVSANSLQVASPDAEGQDVPVDSELFRSIVRVGNFFEIMEIAVRNGAVNEGIVRDYYRMTLHRYAEIARPIVEVIRNDPPKPNSPYGSVRRPRALIGVDKLLKRWPLPKPPATS